MGHGHGHHHSHAGHGHGHGREQTKPVGHAHDHGASDPHGNRTAAHRLSWALLLTATFMVVEVVFGLLTESLALLSDAGHMLTDSGALLLALLAQRIALKPRTRLYTFGFRRAEILAALVNGIVLVVTALLIVVEAIERLKAPPLVQAGPMLWVASTGLLVNLGAALILGFDREHGNANLRAALAHVLSDALGSVASIGAALCVLYLDMPLADPLASLFIAVLIALGALGLVRSTASVLMESVPLGVDLDELERVIRETQGVSDLHDLHAWGISDGFAAVTVHVVLAGTAHGTDVAQAVGERIKQRFGITHVTVQPESPPSSTQLLPIERLLRR